jgi:hypothetical protein
LADLHVVQIRAKLNGAYFVIQEPQVIGEFDLSLQKDQMEYYDGQAVMYQDSDHLDEKNRFLSYWQISDTGVIKSYFTGLTLASRTNQVRTHILPFDVTGHGMGYNVCFISALLTLFYLPFPFTWALCL